MDALDVALLSAWRRLSERVRGDRVEARKRAARRLLKSMRRAPREWCLAVRSNDTRISPWAGCVIEPSEKWVGLRRAHTVTLSGEVLRKLCAPVEIPWPGVSHIRAGDMLGRSPDVLRRWIKRGALQVRYEPPGIHNRSRARKVPVVWSLSPLVAGMCEGRRPHEAWGTLWREMHLRIPEDAELRVERVVRGRGGKEKGWEFVCPGVGAAFGQSLVGTTFAQSGEGSGTGGEGRGTVRCGRRVDVLYSPVRPWSLADALGEDPLEGTILFLGGSRCEKSTTFARSSEGSGTGESSHFSGDPSKSLKAATSMARARGLAPFACARCHRVTTLTLDLASDWNAFVHHASAGLLYGHEVPRPREYRKVRRQRPHVRPNVKGVRGERVLELMALGLSYREIGARMGIKESTVESHVSALFRKHRVKTREALFAARGMRESAKAAAGARRVGSA
jgi:DNA-binding CsgD family transcriptional regulator